MGTLPWFSRDYTLHSRLEPKGLGCFRQVYKKFDGWLIVFLANQRVN